MTRLLSFAIETAEKTGRFLIKHFGETPPLTRATPKEAKSFCDIAADTIIKHSIEKKFPNHSYLTEETGLVKKNSEYLWIIDPLDGTGNFINGNPFFAVSIALWKNNEPLLAVIEAPALKERYIAQKGKGAYLITHRMKKKTEVSKNANISKAYVVFCEGGENDKKRVLLTLDRYYTKVKDMRKLGSAALELTWVGIGRADCYITHAISIWDIAAGMLFVKEAGGELMNFYNKEYTWKEMLKNKTIDLIATNGKINF